MSIFFDHREEFFLRRVTFFGSEITKDPALRHGDFASQETVAPDDLIKFRPVEKIKMEMVPARNERE